MADLHNLDSLPPELQAMIFELLPISALKAMTLVSKQYSAEAAKALWTVSTINLDNPPESLRVISSGGFLDNVRRLSIKTTPDNWDWKNDKVFELLDKLPRERLLAFQCHDFPVSRKVLEALFEKHSHLSELSISPDDDGLPDTSLMHGKLIRLQSVHIKLAYWEEIPCGIGVLFERMSGVQEMRLEPTRYDEIEASWSSPLPHQWPNLQRLVIRQLDLCNTTVCTAATPYMPRLKVLELLKCSRSADFLQLIAGRYNKRSGSRYLESFVCQMEISEFNKSMDDLAKLLKSAKSLTKFVLDIDGDEEIRILSRVGPPVNTWTELQFTVFSDPWYQIRSAHDIAYIAVSCKDLERLVIGTKSLLGATNDSFDLEELMHTSGPLMTIAKMPKLKRLSLVECLEEPFSLVQGFQSFYERAADQIMDFLEKAGSSIEALDFGSGCKTVAKLETDGNGHTWPHYSFHKGSVTIIDQEGQQSVKATAIPTPVVDDTSLFKVCPDDAE